MVRLWSLVDQQLISIAVQSMSLCFRRPMASKKGAKHLNHVMPSMGRLSVHGKLSSAVRMIE